MADTVLKPYLRILMTIKMILMNNFKILDKMNKVMMIPNLKMIKANKMKILFQSLKRVKANKLAKVLKGQNMKMKFNQKANQKNKKFLISKSKKHRLLVQLLNLTLNHKSKSFSNRIRITKNKSILNSISKSGLKLLNLKLKEKPIKDNKKYLNSLLKLNVQQRNQPFDSKWTFKGFYLNPIIHTNFSFLKKFTN